MMLSAELCFNRINLPSAEVVGITFYALSPVIHAFDHPPHQQAPVV
jgi:hypothetical protein